MFGGIKGQTYPSFVLSVSPLILYFASLSSYLPAPPGKKLLPAQKQEQIQKELGTTFDKVWVA